MECRIRMIDSNKYWLITKPVTTIGKENCDINVESAGGLVGGKHAIITEDIRRGGGERAFLLTDNNTCHGTYVNDCRVQNSKVALQDGDVIRLGHGGPRFEVSLEDSKEHLCHSSMSSNLPTISRNPSPFSCIQYGRHNGYCTHNKADKTCIVPHPPVRQRPVSASTANGTFHSVSHPCISGNWTNGVSNNDNAGVKALDSVLDLDVRLHETEQKLTQLAHFESECHKKDVIIGTLREEMEYLRKCKDTSTYTSGCQQKIAALYDQIQIKSEDNDNLRAENDNLRAENDNLRVENGSLKTHNDNLITENNIRSENENLRDEIGRLKSDLKDCSHNSKNELSEIKVLLTERDHKVSLFENEVNRVNREKSQMSLLLNSLQKEITSKDDVVRKTKEEVEKYKIELRNKKSEISTMAAKVSKNSELKEMTKSVKQKEEEITNLRYRLKTFEDKVKCKDTHIQDLHTRIKEANNTIEANETAHARQINDNRYKVKIVEEKLRSKESVIHELHVQISQAQSERSQQEKQQLQDSTNQIEATKNLSSILCEIEKRLIENGRSCKSLNEEINTLQFFDTSDSLRWAKECFLAFLCDECNWESEIESALKLVTGDSERAATPPALLIQILHEKLENNIKEIDKLESKINSSENEHSGYIENLKINIKEKYKKKTEKALLEMKSEEQKKFQEKIMNMREEEGSRLCEALKSQKARNERDSENIDRLTQEIVTLQSERKRTANDLGILQRSLEKSRKNENVYIEKIEENEKINEDRRERENSLCDKLKAMESACKMLKGENESKVSSIEELNTYKEKSKQQSQTIFSLQGNIETLTQTTSSLEENIRTLEENIRTLQLSKDEVEQKFQSLTEILREYREKNEKMKKEASGMNRLTKEVEEMAVINGTLKQTAAQAEAKCDQQKDISMKLKEKLDTALANLSDLKADLNDREKQKIEHLEEKCLKQESELAGQQLQLVKLSTLVDEQKMKLVEQDEHITQQNGMLVDRHIPWAVKEDDEHIPTECAEITRIGQRCIGKIHDEMISDQKNFIDEMAPQSAVRSPQAHPSHRNMQSAHPSHHNMIKMLNAIDQLKVQLAAKDHQSAVTDQEFFDKVCQLRDLLTLANEEVSFEQAANENNAAALEECEELYIHHVRNINKQLDIQQILGAKPISFLTDHERCEILKERAKGLEVILNRIKSLKARLQRKDQLLQHYDDDLKNLRDTENYAGKKTFEVDNLENELTECKNEISYLQEALKKCRGECSDLKRQNNSLKEKKTLMVDYNTDPKRNKQKKGREKLAHALVEEVPVRDTS